jgi:nitrate reductase gamma subunit
MSTGRQGAIEYLCDRYHHLRRIVVFATLAIVLMIPTLFVDTTLATEVVMVLNLVGFGGVLAIVVPIMLVCRRYDSNTSQYSNSK